MTAVNSCHQRVSFIISPADGVVVFLRACVCFIFLSSSAAFYLAAVCSHYYKCDASITNTSKYYTAQELSVRLDILVSFYGITSS